MAGEMLWYAATRATHRMVDPIVWRAIWWAVAGVLAFGAITFVLIGADRYFSAEIGAIASAWLLAGLCIVAALICLAIPPVVEWVSRKFSRKEPDTGTMIAHAVDEEAREAVDHFGAVRVMATAFMVGLGAARQVRGKAD